MRGPVLAFVGLVSCAGAAPPATTAPVAVAAKAPPPAPAPSAPGTIRRAELDRVLDAGFGRFLQTLAVEPNLDAGRFRGWTILDVGQSAPWTGVDLKPGDVVTSVNGMPIEREMEAFDAFESLRKAPELVVAYAREGTPRRLAYRIVP